MKIYNTLDKSKVEFKPLIKEAVSLYVCGVTPYDYAHIGNARPAIVFDTLYRFLTAQGHKVTYVRNFTDVDDKIIVRAGEQKVKWQELTAKYMRIYHEDMAGLNVLGSADTNDIIEPKVTDHIPEIINMIKTLLEKGHAYVGKSGDVLFDTKSFPDYGKLSGNTLEALNMGQRIAVSEDKKHETDFVLWKSVKPNEPMQWDFDYSDKDGQKVNAGRPGWHIECSAMSAKYLGQTFDIHCGGEDLKFPHHECEIAQSKGANGGQFARYWMHNAFINVNGEKMSKSLGNFKTIHGLLEKYSGEALRLWMLSTHYRKPVDLTEEALDRAEAKLKRWYLTLKHFNDTGFIAYHPKAKSGFSVVKPSALFIEALSDDLNTSKALGVLNGHFTLLNKYLEEDTESAKHLYSQLLLDAQTLGLLCQDPQAFLQGDIDNVADIQILVEQRDTAKTHKDWALADKIRDDLKAQGIVLEDSTTGTTWRKG